MTNHSLSAVPTPIVGRALLVTSDASLAQQLKNGMSKFAISAETCSEPAIAGNLVHTRKFEAIVVDLTIGQLTFAVGFLEKVRQSPSNHHSVTFAISDPEIEVRVKSNFVLHKPLTEANLAGTLKAALGLIIRDYRRYFRCPVAIPVRLKTEDAVEAICETLNISEGGVALTVPVILKPDSRVKLHFSLPEERNPFWLDAEVCWFDNKGRAGLQFGEVSSEDQQRLQSWLSRTIEKGLPDSVARFFKKEE
jgi:hypothetical protein